VGIDSSLLRLPDSEELRKEFTLVETGNQLGPSGIGYPEGRMSVFYDLLNKVGLDGRLEPSSVDETALAIQQLQGLKPGDVTLSDRGFPGYVYFAWHQKLGLEFVARCSRASFAAALDLFRMNRAGRSVRVKLVPRRDQLEELRRLGLPLELVVRFVSVRLSTGELEVLATSLLDEERYPTQEFQELYHQRWGLETFYGTMKGRLDLENFSGKTAEAVRQDFFATLLLCNLETALSEPARQALGRDSAEHKHPKQINRAVAFHALKDRMLDLLYSDLPTPEVIEKLQLLFAASPVSVRPERKPPRRKPSLNRSYHFQRRVKKIVF
jgi:DDE family transposase